MSQIDKLAIRGIRSFDNQSIAVIQFYSPLTVIVGHNGSGKTTIIECLKYITTGDLPPNTKGGAFVHDPSIAGEAVVMAEVLLRFKNLAGTKLIASRRLQVTKKKNTALTMKTLEGTLSYNDNSSAANAKRKTISTKCAEMDSEVPRHLGVSKAILENVIFCHQEDSNWPLSEPASLKKKFDEIFEATKYTKALDNIKSIKKEAAAELKVDKEKHNALVIDKTRADKLQSSIEKIANSIKTKEAEYEKLEDNIRKLTEENKKFYEGALRFKEILNEHSTLKDQKSNKLKIIKDLLEDTEEIKDATDSQLIERREQSKNSLSNHAGRLAQAKSQLAAAEEDLSKLRSKHQSKFTVLGQLKAQAQRKVAALEERQEAIASISSAHKISEFQNQPIPDGRVVEFYNLLQDQRRCAITELERIKKAGKSAEEEKQAEIFKLKSDEGSAQQRKHNVADRVDETRRKIRSLVHQIESVNVSEADIKIHSDNLEAKQESLATLKQELNKADYDNNITTKQKDVENLDVQREKLHVELVGLNRQSDTRAKLALKRTDVSKKDEGIKTIIQIHGARFQELIGTEMTPQSAEQDINRALLATERKLTDATAKSADVTKDMQTIDTKLQLNKSKLTTTRREVERLEKTINEGTHGEAVSVCIEDAELEIEALNRDLHGMQFSVTFHENLLSRAKEANKCGACQRLFHGEDEIAAFERYCKQTIAKLPQDRSQREKDLKDWQAQLNEMKGLLPLEVSAKKLRDSELPNLQEEGKELESKLSAAKQKVEEAHSEMEKLKDQLSELTLCKRPATDIIRMKSEIEELNREIKGLEADLESSGTTRTTNEVQEELDDLNLHLVESKREMQTLINEREKKRTMINNVQSQVHQLELSLSMKQQQMKERESFQAQKEELRKEIIELEEKMKQIEDLLKTFSAPIRRAEVDLEQIRSDNAAKESEQATELQAYNTSLNRIQAINKEIQRYDEMEIDTNCKRCQSEIDKLDESIKSYGQQVSDSQESLLDLDKEATKAKAFERNISDNIRLRTYRREIGELDEKIKDLDIDAATRSNAEYDKEYHKARKYLTDCQAEQAKIGGEIGIDKKVLKDKKSELDSEFKDIVARHRAQLVKVKTVELANQDLDKYAKALDQAIMKYHSHKMAEINDTIQNLWQKTYQGTDIDNISIKSENENIKSNRSYNYRVVMMKDQVEMDMRGRCSAGQKVLASIIIRLALAESFGTNCGILALDEPTTNLDKDNIDALAGALAEIIKERKDQSNFQLVVITHDEDFLNQLGQADVLDKYWRVSRNLQQKSIIERQRLV